MVVDHFITWIFDGGCGLGTHEKRGGGACHLP